jgi:hypothetical protein
VGGRHRASLLVLRLVALEKLIGQPWVQPGAFSKL